MTTRLDWDGERLLARVREATRQGINDTTAEAARVAQTGHWWNNRTGNLERNVITERAHRFGKRIVGRFGATYSGQKGVRSGFYGLFLEMKIPWLRPAADEVFPTLAANIRRRMK